MKQPTPSAALRTARQQLLAHGECPAEWANEPLARSWQRSLAAGLNPDSRLPPAEHSSGSALAQALARHHGLLAHSRPVMEYLFEQVRHSQSVVVLADPSGTLVHTLGDAQFVSKANRVALSSGASWHENHRGTNAIGTALAEAKPIEVHGAEHFLERNGFLTCAAAPIVSATGQTLGVLDISGDHRGGHPHSLGLVSTAARMIENRLLVASCRHHMRLHLHAQAEGIGTVAEGMVAIADSGWLVGANRMGLKLLGLGVADIGCTAITTVLDLNLPQLLSRHARQPGHIHHVHRPDGSTLCAQLHLDTTTLNAGLGRTVAASAAAPPPAAGAIHTAPAAVHSPSVSASASASSFALASADAAPAPPPSPPLHSDALAALDTGDARWRAAADKARRVLGKPIALLIQGESGVGKELFARASHDSGPRRQGPFVAINCAAIPEHLIESELFGHEAGAFTGARREGRLGRLREADGGTLFLDEIGDMPLALQTRLLRVLQERQVTPLGGGQAVPVDFALVCATHHQLRQAADKGLFRADLYYRINGLTVNLPALRERTDFAVLTARLLADLSPQQPVAVEPALMAQLAAHPWPGNLRQWASVLRTACAMLDSGDTLIGPEHLADDVLDDLRAACASAPATSAPPATSANPTSTPTTAAHAATHSGHAPGAGAGSAATGLHSLQALSCVAIQAAVQASGGNLSQAARSLGISRQTLYRKRHAMGLHPVAHPAAQPLARAAGATPGPPLSP